MKTLFIALLILVSLTIKLAYDKKQYTDYMEDDLQRRAFIVYSRTFQGCMVGAEFADMNYDFIRTYSYCRTLAFDEKDRYLVK